MKYTNAVSRNGATSTMRTAKPPGGYRAAGQRYAWQDSNLRPLGPQPNALSPELQARIDHFTPEGQRPAVADQLGREGRDSNPRSAFSALNRLAGGPIRPLWHLPRWLCPRLASGVACTGFQTEKSTTGPMLSPDPSPVRTGIDPTTPSIRPAVDPASWARIEPPHPPAPAAPAVARLARRHRQFRSGEHRRGAAR
jgi:hypothetical protein